MVTVAPDLAPARIPYGDAYLGVLVARRQWPTSPCVGHEQVLVARTPPPAVDGDPRPVNRMLIGRAYLGGQRCLIWIRPGMSRTLTCTTVVHELGHWDDQDHTPTGVMAADAGRMGAYPWCDS